ncbi:sugar transferase [Candidatus Saccharibacteria bacterium]|nr:sugar transferase [Candidatus Saccharibacteria bacterium]
MAKYENQHKPYGPYEKYFKRPLDFLFSLLALIILSPILLITYILVIIFLGFPGIFKQPRPGRDEKIFNLYKFRTMTNTKDKNGKLLPDEKRLTKFGKFLRSTSLDELPELFNILIGDMSFIGPRPLLVDYLPRYNIKQRRRHEIRPGLTGLAQVSGRNSIPWQKRFDIDILYVDRITFLQDSSIILKTISLVLKRKNINSNTSATMEEFMGN